MAIDTMKDFEQTIASSGLIMDRRSALQGGLMGGLAALAGAGFAREAHAEGERSQVRLVITGNNVQGKSYFIKNELVPADYAPTMYLSSPKELGMLMGPGNPGDYPKILPPDPPGKSGLGSHAAPDVYGVIFGMFHIPDTALYQKPRGEPLQRVGGKDGFHRTITMD